MARAMTAPQTAGIAPPRILVVDDAEINRVILARLLSKRGFIVTEADSGAAAIEEVENDLPDLVLLDIRMADISGVEVLRHLRRTHDACVLPIIMVTGEDDLEVATACLSAGAGDYITKPVHWPILHARIVTHLGLHRAHAELQRDRTALQAVVSARALDSARETNSIRL
jgi:DNA-binding response OmpR family regulator